MIWPVCNNGITHFYLPLTYEPYLPLLLSRKALPPFGWWYSLRLHTKGWPGWVDLGGWSHTEINGGGMARNNYRLVTNTSALSDTLCQQITWQQRLTNRQSVGKQIELYMCKQDMMKPDTWTLCKPQIKSAYGTVYTALCDSLKWTMDNSNNYWRHFCLS